MKVEEELRKKEEMLVLQENLDEKLRIQKEVKQ
jgi:hypothetical protein